MHQLNPQIAWRRIDDETVLIEPDSGKVFVLNTVGADVWGGLELGESKNSIAQRVASTYQVPEERAQSDVERFLAELEQRSLVTSGGSLKRVKP